MGRRMVYVLWLVVSVYDRKWRHFALLGQGQDVQRIGQRVEVMCVGVDGGMCGRGRVVCGGGGGCVVCRREVG